MNFARALENLGQAASAWLAPRERGEISESAADPMTDMVKTLSKVTEYWISDPRRTFEAQTQLMSALFGIWMRSMQRMQGDAGNASRAGHPQGQALFGRGLAEEPVLRFPPPGLFRDGRLGGEDGVGDRGPRRAHQAQGRLLRQADHGSAFADQFHRHQSAALPRDDRHQRRQPGARHEDAGRGYRCRTRRSSPSPDRHDEIRRRPRHGADTRQGDRPERHLPDHPVRGHRPKRC